jgi:hypothetical protein
MSTILKKQSNELFRECGDLFNSIFVFGTRKLSDDENLVSYDSLLFAETIRFDKYSGANSFLDLYINKAL